MQDLAIGGAQPVGGCIKLRYCESRRREPCFLGVWGHPSPGNFGNMSKNNNFNSTLCDFCKKQHVNGRYRGSVVIMPVYSKRFQKGWPLFLFTRKILGGARAPGAPPCIRPWIKYNWFAIIVKWKVRKRGLKRYTFGGGLHYWTRGWTTGLD